MSKVAVLSVPEEGGGLSYLAVQGNKQAVGTTVGKALDALTEQFPMTTSTIVIVQQLHPDAFFGAQDQQRLGELMQRWHVAQTKDEILPVVEQKELEDLIEKELKASEQRAAAFVQTLESNH
jgi:microcompartment protein CcmL/EutN